jgi:diguanylate cyclase (GGDEF)-like protein
MLLAWIAVPVAASVHWSTYALATGMLALTGLLGCLPPVRRWNATLGQAPASVAFLGAVALLRASGPAIRSGADVLALIPVFYTALYGTGRRPMYILLGSVAVFYLEPIVLVGPPSYPHSQYVSAVLTVAVSSLIGLATQRLVQNVRGQAVKSGRRERMLEQVGVVVRTLFASLEPRIDICRAVMQISDATVAVLLEPDPASGVLYCTAAAGTEAPATLPALDSDDPLAAALQTRRAMLLTESSVRSVAGSELAEACGPGASILLQPMLRAGSAVGVLVVGWPADVEVSGGRETVVELLAHEAAFVIDRADELTLLAGMAETDPLTGLPNRRAWDARMSRVTADDEKVTVAMLDIDHFKQFNDGNGHPAGDRLLRETAAVWRELLRADDLLARLGGEEFGLLLVNCTPASAADVTERLRVAVTGGQTASAGLAVRRPGEPLESVLGRADHALYDAKAAGRDHARTAA